MNTLIIDGRKCKSKAETHEYLARKEGFPDYYGKNLDALYDVLTDIGDKTHLRISFANALKKHLGDYGEKMIQVAMDAAKNNPNITFELED